MGIPMNDAEIDKALSTIEYWQRSGNAIEREFKFNDFLKAINFVNRVAQVAEDANHHPDIVINFNKVKLSLTSHDSGGVTQRDIRLATAINKVKE